MTFTIFLDLIKNVFPHPLIQLFLSSFQPIVFVLMRECMGNIFLAQDLIITV
jgi:hypothetical protein